MGKNLTTFLLTHFFSQQHSVMSLQNASEEAITEWVKAFHRASDSLTTTDLGQFYTKNGSLKFANNDLLDGLDATTAFFGNTFPLLVSMKHDIVNLGMTHNRQQNLSDMHYHIHYQR